MTYSYISSKDVLALLPLDTWTEVILTTSHNDVYIATSEEKEMKRKKDQVLLQMLQNNNILQKIKEYKPLEIVAVEIKGEWYRGKLVSYNEFQDNDTRVELFDVGLVHLTKLSYLFKIPDYFLYEPLVLPIKFKNFIPKTRKLKIRPLLSESSLYEGVVLVDVDLRSNNIQQEKNVENKNEIHLSDALSNSFLAQGKQSLPFKNGDYCIITYFDRANFVYVVKASKSITDNSYNYWNSKIMSKTANSKDKITIHNKQLGQMVKVFSSKKECFCRAIILCFYPKKLFGIQLVDFGEKKRVSGQECYELAIELQKPGFAVKIGICNNTLQNYENKEKIEDMFAMFIEEKKVFVIEFNERAENCLESVELKHEDGSYINFDDYLKENCLSIEDFSITNTEELNHINDTENITKSFEHAEDNLNGQNEANLKRINNIDNFDELCKIVNKPSNIKVTVEPKKTEMEKPCYPIKSSVRVIITHFENLEEMYIREASYEALQQFQMFNVKMKKYYRIDSYRCTKETVNVGDIVCVSSILNAVKFCRARVYEINGNEYKVFNVDYGNIETLTSNEIFELPREFEKLPYFARKIKLQNMPQVTTESENQEIKNYFKKNCDSHFIIEYDELNPNGFDNVILLTDYYKTDITDVIRTLLNALPQ